MDSILTYSTDKERKLRKLTGVLFILIPFLVPSELIIVKTTIKETTFASLLYLIKVIQPISSNYGSNAHWEITVFPMSLVFKVPLLIVIYFGYELLRTEKHQEMNVLGALGVAVLQVLFLYAILSVPHINVVSRSLLPYSEFVILLIGLAFLGWLGLTYEEKYKASHAKNKKSRE